MTEFVAECVSCGWFLSAEAERQGFRLCHDCFVKTEELFGGKGGDNHD